jgi:hypothetical protein
MRAEKFRILPALDRSVEFAQKNGWITPADSATVAQAFCLAGVIDNMPDDSKELVNLSRQLQLVLDRLGLSVAGRDDKPSITDEVTPLDRIKDKQIDWITTSQDLNYTNDKPN